MGRLGITYQDVEHAIQAVSSKQKSLTVDNVRAELGTGSKSTIGRFLKDWRAQNCVQDKNENALPLELLNTTKTLWEKLRAQMESQKTEYQFEADKQISDAKAELEKVITKNQGLEILAKKQEDELLDKTEQHHQLKDKFVILQNENSKLVERVASFDVRHQETQSELERLHLLLKHVQENLEHYQEATHQLRQEQALLLEKQRNEYEQKNIDLSQKITLLIQEKSLIEAQMEHINQRYIELQHEHQHTIQTLKTQQKDYQQLLLTYETSQQTKDFLANQYQQQTEVLQLKNNLEVELRVMLETMQIKANSMIETHALAQERILSLEQEKEALFFQKTSIEKELSQLQAVACDAMAKI